jgi:hypothetical protein
MQKVHSFRYDNLNERFVATSQGDIESVDLKQYVPYIMMKVTDILTEAEAGWHHWINPVFSMGGLIVSALGYYLTFNIWTLFLFPLMVATGFYVLFKIRKGFKNTAILSF